jgi:flagellar hook-length control protein FliK
MVASLAVAENGLPQTALMGDGATETDLDMVMKQIHLPQEKLPALPSDAMKAVSSVNTMLDAATDPSEKSPDLAKLSPDLVAEGEEANVLLDQETAANNLNQSAVSETVSDIVDSELTAESMSNVSQTVSPEKLTGLTQASENVTENTPDEAKASDVLASLKSDADNESDEVEPLMKANSAMDDPSQKPSGVNEVHDGSQNTVPGMATSANGAAQAQTAESNIKDVAQEKERPPINAQMHTNQSKADTALGKEMGDGKSLKSEAGISTSTQQNTASSQSNQQGQQSFSGQQQQAQQQFMNQVQKQVVQTQQEAVKNANEASVAEAEKAEKAEKVLGNLGLGMNAKKTAGQSFSIGHPVRSPQWGQALGQKVTYMANNKIQEAKITLNPEKLGPIQVKLSLDKDQHAHVSMVTQHGTTRDAIENAMPRLKEMLEAAGIGFGSFDVRDENGSSEQSLANQNGQSGSGQSSGGLLAGGEEVEADGNGMVQTVSSDNLVDFYA